MQACTSSPETTALVNEKTVPYALHVTERGIPDEEFPFFSSAQAWLDSPWFRVGGGTYVLTDPQCTEIFGCLSYGWRLIGGADHERFTEMEQRQRLAVLHEDLTRQVEQYEREQRLLRLGAAGAEELAALREARRKEISGYALQIRNPRAWTAQMLCEQGNFPWEMVHEVEENGVWKGRKLSFAPGAKNAICHCLGDLLTNESELTPDERSFVRTLRERWSTRPTFAEYFGARSPEIGTTLPPAVLRRAAYSLGRLTRQADWSRERPDLVEVARAWWRSHREDPAWAIGWPTDPERRFVMFVERGP